MISKIVLKIGNFWRVSRHDEYLHKVSELFTSGQSKVKLRQKLKLYIYTKYYKNSNKSCTFAVFRQIGPALQMFFFSYFHVQYEYKSRVCVNFRVLTKKLTNTKVRKLPIFASNSTILRIKISYTLKSIVAARVYSQCSWYLGYITQKKTQTSMSCEDGCRALSKDWNQEDTVWVRNSVYFIP